MPDKHMGREKTRTLMHLAEALCVEIRKMRKGWRVAMSLWGNRADLSLWPAGRSGDCTGGSAGRKPFG